jgi:hypothetical protein
MGCLVWNTAHVLMVSLDEKPLTGEPDAGKPPVRFGGRGGANPAIPTPIKTLGDRCRALCVRQVVECAGAPVLWEPQASRRSSSLLGA